MSFILFTLFVLVAYFCYFLLLPFFGGYFLMLYLFFDALSENLLHVCHSSMEYLQFLDSEFYGFLKQTKASDLVCYRVRDSALLKFAKGYKLNHR